MMNMENNCFTPEKIAQSDMIFSIPLYQRLFEWGEQEVVKLIEDLKEHYAICGEKPYFLGMLTAYRHDNCYDLVDGQQRFTVMTLLAIVCKWRNFLICSKGSRLIFFARDKDKEYLKKKVEDRDFGKDDYVNPRMEEALKVIVKKLDEFGEQIKGFEDFIFRRLTFFVSILPEKYNSADLNKYFETMNSAGRGLENHEILKVELLKKVTGPKEIYTRIWNAVSRMDKMVLPKSEDQDREEYQKCFIRMIEDVKNQQIAIEAVADKLREYSEGEGRKIRDIAESKSKPKENGYLSETEGEHSIISFPEFLLLVLDMQQKKGGRYEFYKTDKLLERFHEEVKLDIAEFFRNLLLYRLLLDFYIIRIKRSGSGNLYELEFRSQEQVTKECQMYQSMLYVSTEFYRWVKPLLDWLGGKQEVDAGEMLWEMKKIDQKQREFHQDKLSYPMVDRYWFWCLDYYLWEEEFRKGPEGEKDKLILNYVFRRNRSIEHLHPQSQENNLDWEEQQVHSFGNLAMISQGFNSAQGNDNVNVKFGRIRGQIEQGGLESIKMYKMYLAAQKEESNWTVELMQKHQDEMIRYLTKNFADILSGNR